ncbi:MAG: hypothetical protein J0H40_24050 [Rhizobiales bacterium]|nr:hypothetical protein [Hyphomicrobiales bacterium]
MIFEHDSAGTMACRTPQSGIFAAIVALLLVGAATLMLVAPASADGGVLRVRIAPHYAKGIAGV